jgi:thiamine-phosphate diphosphorylase
LPDPRLGDQLRLYLVADPDHASGDLANMVERALAGGVTAVQLRCKTLSDRAQLDLAQAVRALTRQAGALFLVNDRLDIALAAGADGVHLGVDDLPLSEARRIGGPGMILGYSPETDTQTEAAALTGADYLGVGPVFGTSTKGDAGAAIGLGVLARRARLAMIPVVGIGGITIDNAASVIRAGAAGIAVVSAISRQTDPQSAARTLRTAIEI